MVLALPEKDKSISKFGRFEKYAEFEKKSSSWFIHLLYKRPNHEENFSQFCDLLRKSELYMTATGKLKTQKTLMHARLI